MNTTDPGLAGPAPDEGDERAPDSGTAAAGNRVDSPAAAPDHPGTSSNVPGEGAVAGNAAPDEPPVTVPGSSAKATGGAASTVPPAAPEQERTDEWTDCPTCGKPRGSTT